MTKLTLIRGLPGSGKSTYAKQLQLSNIARHLEADMYFIDRNGDYMFDARYLGHAHEWCLQSTGSFLIAGIDVIVSNTFTTMKEMRPYIDLANGLGAALDVVEMHSQYGSIHNVPEETMAKMRARWMTLPKEYNVRVA